MSRKRKATETKSSGQAKGRNQSDVEINMKRVSGVLRKKYQKETYFINEERLRSRVDALFVPLFLSLDFVLFTPCKVLNTSPCNVAPPSAVPLIIGHMQRSTVYKKINIRSTAGLPRARAGLLHFKVQWEYCMQWGLSDFVSGPVSASERVGGGEKEGFLLSLGLDTSLILSACIQCRLSQTAITGLKSQI